LKESKPKVLIFDVETAPIQAYVWGLWDQTVSLNMIKSDWHLLSWSAKWLGDPPSKVMYADNRKQKNIENDKKLLKGIWDLLNEADIVITQNGKKFDQKKLNARFVFNGMQPPSSYKHIDTLLLAKKHFGFTSNKLEYMTDKLCVKYKKLQHKKFPGFELWSECLKGNIKAWKEMEKYNKHDVLSLEELYTKLRPWDSSINFSLYNDGEEHICQCGSTDFLRNGFYYTPVSKFIRLRCKKCGSEVRERINQFDADKKRNIKVGTVR
jgi:RNase_H superfamily